MNPLVKKEIRLLLPGFLIGCVLTFADWFLFLENLLLKNTGSISNIWSLIPLVACPAVAVMIALDSFGAEVGSGIFTNLLAQPVSRLKIWETKISLLAIALLVFGVLWFAPVFYVRSFMAAVPDDSGGLFNLFAIEAMFALVVFSGGLWTVLLLRQTAAAFWFTILVPGVILVILAGLFADYSGEFQEGMIVSVLGLYSLAGFFFARWLFLRAQDVTWTGGTIAMPEMRGLPVWFSRSAIRRVFRPRAALWWKEIQLHQAQFIMAGVLALLHIGVITERKFGHYQINSSTEFVLEIFWCLWLVMPMLVGAAAVAEERKLGTLAGQFCLPVKRRAQFAVKFSVVLILSVLFGVVMPLLLEGSRILPDIHFKFVNVFVEFRDSYGWQSQMSTAQTFVWICVGEINGCLPLLTLAGMAVAIGAISFYASTLARNTLQALAPSVLGILLTYFLFIVTSQPGAFGFHLPWNGLLIYFTGVPVFFIVLLAMSSWNFQRINLGWNIWRRNAFVFAAALAFVFVATTAIYHRAWEKLTPFEPPHGAARLTLSNPPALSDQWNTLSVRLSDGRIWTGNFTLNTMNPIAPNPLALFLDNIRLTMSDGHFLEGSNWVNVISSGWGESAGIKTDGTLWVSETPVRRERLASGGWRMVKAGDLVQFGSETNWSSVVPIYFAMLLVKSDGTLWRWGVTNLNYNRDEWPDLRSFTPKRLGTDTNWSEVFLEGGQFYFRKNDGRLWTTWIQGGNNPQTNELAPGFLIERTSLFEHGKRHSTTRIWSGLSYELGIRNDGTFRIWADEKLNQKSRYYEPEPVDLQFGKDTNWLAVAGRDAKVVTLKNDGTLWLWNFYHDSLRGWDPKRDEREMLDSKPVHLGTHSDWIAIATADGGIISLAADGSLWYWPLESAQDFMAEIYGDNGNNSGPLLYVSRKPQFLGNIFGKAD